VSETPDVTSRPLELGAPELSELEWQIEGRLVDASNVVVRLMTATGERAVFKPVRGEQPLRDFRSGTLAHREVATYLVAAAAGMRCVPETTWHVDPQLGEGSLQRWVGPLEPAEQDQVALLDEDELTDDVHAIAAFDTDEGPLVLAHHDGDPLRDVALLDVLTNNADRKGSHLIEDTSGGGDMQLYAIDHGLTFHIDDKLRTVLWGFAGEPLSAAHDASLAALLAARDGLGAQLSAHLDDDEVEAFFERVAALRTAGVFPQPPSDRYPLPWPPL